MAVCNITITLRFGLYLQIAVYIGPYNLSTILITNNISQVYIIHLQMFVTMLFKLQLIFYCNMHTNVPRTVQSQLKSNIMTWKYYHGDLIINNKTYIHIVYTLLKSFGDFPVLLAEEDLRNLPLRAILQARRSTGVKPLTLHITQHKSIVTYH
jgi:hypothetical protein